MKVRIKFEFILEREWEDKYANKEHIEFCLNEGTWCQSNLIDWMREAEKKSERGCLCRVIKATFLEPQSKNVLGNVPEV